MSKAQGDHFKTWTNESLNNYISNVYAPKLREAVDLKIKEYRINGGKIVCEEMYIVEEDGLKLKGIKRTGEKEYILRIYADEDSKFSDVVKVFNNKDEANECFKYWKMELQH